MVMVKIYLCIYGDGYGDGDTPLMLEASQGHAKIVSILLKNKADVNRQNRRGVEKTAIMLAAEQGSFEIVSALSDNGALGKKQEKYINSSCTIINA